MKKLFYILLLSFVTGLSVTGCTEEEVQPTAADNGGGNTSDFPK